MLFPSPSVWKMLKDAPNQIPEDTIGYAQTSYKIHEGDISLYFR